MIIYAGIDEAGYGPVLGPLVVGRTVFRLDGAAFEGTPPSLWAAMKSVVCRKKGDRRGRIAIDDSKILHTGWHGLRNLERGVLSFLWTAGTRPASLDEMLAVTAFDGPSRASELPWYADPDGRPRLPVHADPDDLSASMRRLRRVAGRKGIRLENMGTAVVFEDRFNSLVRRAGTKSVCVWEFVAGHLRFIWENYGDCRPFVAVDQLGGRTDYRGLLATSLPWADVVMSEGTDGLPAYILRDDGREMQVVFRVRCEEAHLPVALASMLAKYTRELFMVRFRAFWQDLAPGIRPTYGYLPDGNRFIDEIMPLMDSLGIRREDLVRSC
jgi:hypothetical protein